MARYHLTLADYKISLLILVWVMTMHTLVSVTDGSPRQIALSFALGVLTVVGLLVVSVVISAISDHIDSA